MTEEEARDWVVDHFGSGALPLLQRIADAVIVENERQNLIAPSTITSIWSRHIVDSAQLLLLGDPRAAGHWLDIGSGAGFPGMVVATLRDRPMQLVEVRKKRAEFLTSLAAALGLSARVTVISARVETLNCPASTISARAVASLSEIFDLAEASASRTTQWILPKGRSAREEVERARQAWHGVFHVEQSVTDPDSSIVIASNVTRRGTQR